ncbi:MNIO family bufferin maturase [Burkholderia sp. AW33-5]
MSDSIGASEVSLIGRPNGLAVSTRLLAGTSFKHEHLSTILADGPLDGFFEVHAENYMGAGGPPHRMLTALRENYPISIHGVCMSIGGPDPLDANHLERFRALVTRYEPALVSEHLAWSSHGNRFYNDLLPLPYTKGTLNTVCEHIHQFQEATRRRILIENPSTYVAFASSTMSETDFIREVVQRTGCGLLLDVNNVFVSATNHGYLATDYLADFPLEHVREIHLAGHTEQRDDENEPLLIDSHDCSVSDTVWELYRAVISRVGPTPTLVEWDSKLPDWPVLRKQSLTARQIMIDSVTIALEDSQHEI